MNEYDQLRLDAQLCFPIYAATRAITKRYGELLAATGLTYPQYLVMLVLWEGGAPVTVGELGERLRLDSGTLTPLLKRLETAGLVERRRDADDERRVLVSLTSDGLAARDKVADVPRQLGASMGLSLQQAMALRDDLNAILERLDAASSPR